VRHKHLRGLIQRLGILIGIDIDLADAFLETASFGPWTLLIVDRKPLAIEVPRPDDLSDDERQGGVVVPFPTLRGILEWNIGTRWCAVDAGAIPFLMNGADCMGAGVHIADPGIERGNLVWIRDQEHGKPLALGWALLPGNEMVAMTKGKAIRTIHWVGDELWEIAL